MIPATQSIRLACGGCGRAAQLTIAILSRRRNCMYCGAEYALTPEVAEAVAAQDRSTPTRPRIRPAVAITCPICGQTSRFKGDDVGTSSRCRICGCPFVVPDSDGHAEPTPGTMKVPVLAELDLPGVPCPHCRSSRLQSQDQMGHLAGCTACGAPIDLTALPIQHLVGMSADLSHDRLLSFAGYVLAVRWARRGSGLAEAALLHEDIGALHRWVPGTGLDSPFEPARTAEILQWAVYSAPGSSIARDGDLVRLILLGIEGDGPSDAQLIALNVVGIGLAALTGSGFTVSRKDSRDEGEVPPALVLAFLPEGTGSRLEAVEIREESGRLVGAGSRIEAGVRASVESSLAEAARRYVAFQCLYGIWAAGSMYRGASEAAIARRVESIGEPLSDHAADWAALLVAGRGVEPREI